MTLKVAKSPDFDGVKEIPGIVEEIARHKAAYQEATGKPWPLSDDDIVNLIAYSEDDRDDWMPALQAYVNGNILPA